MIEVVPGTIERVAPSVSSASKVEDLGPARLSGEIVDSGNAFSA
jgi:hypothetical protein